MESRAARRAGRTAASIVTPDRNTSANTQAAGTRLTVSGMGVAALTSLVLSMVIMAAIEYAKELIPIPPLLVSAVDVALSLASATLLFAMIFKICPMSTTRRSSSSWAPRSPARSSSQRGDRVIPKSTAVRVHLDIMEDDGGGMKKVSEVD